VNTITNKSKVPKNTFKEKHSLEERKISSKRIMEKNPDRYPIIVIPGDGIKIDKEKYLVPSDVTVGSFFYILRQRVNLKPEEAMFLFVNNTLPPVSALVSHIYNEHKDEDGYLYATLLREQVYGILL